MSKPARKVLLVANTSWYLYNFRRPLARALTARGLSPVLLSPRDAYSERLLQEGFVWREIQMSRSRLNPIREFGCLLRFIRTYRSEAPVAVHHFTIKCVIYGTLAAVANRIPVRINAVTGLGHVFLSRSWKAAMLRIPVRQAYRFVLGVKGSRVIFQNLDDRQTFVDTHLVKLQRTMLIRSSGVDLSSFVPRPTSETNPPPTLRVLFASRLLREKGVLELIEAIRILRSRPNPPLLSFTIAGMTDPGNPSSILAQEVEQWRREGLAEFPGHVDPILELIANSDLVVLPSYREGTPRILLEACAMKKPVITTDVPGCREVIEHGKNGLLIPPRDSIALADAITQLAKDSGLRASMGEAGRSKMVAEFSDVEIARQTLEAYELLGVLS